MKYKVAIQEMSTKEVRFYDPEVDWDEASEYWWTDGNMGCDCNLHLSFLRAGGPRPADDPHWNNAERECGNIAYWAMHAELEDGSKIDLQEPPTVETNSAEG